MKHDVIVVGCGPAGIFTALELASYGGLDVVMLDKGKDVEHRRCPANRGLGCVKCNPCNLLSGWGGSGAFSDGKLTLSSEVGGWLNEYLGKEELDSLINYVDELYVKFGAPNEVYGVDMDRIGEFKHKASLAGLKLIPVKVRHLGTERCVEVVKAMRRALEGKVEVKTGIEVEEIIVEEGKLQGVRVKGGEVLKGKYVVVAPGRSGAAWLKREAERLGLKLTNNPVDVGVRVEIPAYVMEHLSDVLYEPKFIYYSKTFDDKVRTFCFNPHGEVITEYYDGVVTVNGQSYVDRRTDNSNFALLVSTSFTEPFKEPIAYGRYIASLANLLGGGVIVQRLGDLKSGRRSTWDRIKRSSVEPTLKTATPGDISFVLPYRYLTNILEMLKALDQVAPGVYSNHTLLYGVEVKFYSSRLELSSKLETKVSNLFAIGDGAGITRGLVQASASGVWVAREILRREGLYKA
ncbi:MAG: FAD-dependent oxidoreductase [Thermoprotei archaeon]|nr:MAG: FAD-dependent oxidoreductase [Thermoprotei archaeon]